MWLMTLFLQHVVDDGVDHHIVISMTARMDVVEMMLFPKLEQQVFLVLQDGPFGADVRAVPALPGARAARRLRQPQTKD